MKGIPMSVKKKETKKKEEEKKKKDGNVSSDPERGEVDTPALTDEGKLKQAHDEKIQEAHNDEKDPLGPRGLERCEEIFKSLDQDGLERISAKELFLGLRRDGQKKTMHQAEVMIKAAKGAHRRWQRGAPAREKKQEEKIATAAAAEEKIAAPAPAVAEVGEFGDDKSETAQTEETEETMGVASSGMDAAGGKEADQEAAAPESSSTDQGVMTKEDFFSIMRERAVGLHSEIPSQSFSDW